jgi:hypothetical protein
MPATFGCRIYGSRLGGGHGTVGVPWVRARLEITSPRHNPDAVATRYSLKEFWQGATKPFLVHTVSLVSVRYALGDAFKEVLGSY